MESIEQAERHPKRVAIHCGALVDNYLFSEGAIAQAVDQNTILVGSAAFGMNFADQRILLLHELAHLHQLAKPGNDPVRSLEDEAWDAAHAWASGRLYRVRGQARHPLNALAIIQGGDKGHPSAPPWYRSNPVEPIGNKSTITVDDVIVQKTISLESVMDTIIEKGQKEVVIVCHGTKEGLALPFVAGSSLGAQPTNIARLAADRVLIQADGQNTPIFPDTVFSKQLSEERIKSLRAKMNKIRGLNLQHVAFRACDIAREPSNLDAFRLLFGVKSVSAPKLKDSYGQFRPEIGRGIDLKTWVEAKRKKQGFRMWIDRGVAFGIRAATTISQTEYQIVSRAPDKPTFETWVRAHVADASGVDSALVYHGMKDASVADQTAPIIYFIRDSAFINNIVFFSA